MTRFRNPGSRLIVLVLMTVFAERLMAEAIAPNVILVITDDQGYGDLAAHGNQMIQTPHLDALHAQSVRFTDFHVDPSCSPTRSSLMTGRYSTRTGVWHTIMGRSIMNTDEQTIAEVFQSAGYATGMYGKWHLGDNYPCRPQDQGFDEAFYNGGGGVGQTPDYFGNDYFDDTYMRNGKLEKVKGYCTDVWFREAMTFIENNRGGPFFLYLSTNAPHAPFLVDDSYSGPYREKGVPDEMAAFYGMITNIDDNMGKLLKFLEKLNLDSNTILIFMTDNGTAAGSIPNRKQLEASGNWKGFNAGMRGKKGSSYDGGHRVPFFVRWPDRGIQGGRDVKTLSAHIDVLPTLAELCQIELKTEFPIDGRSLVPDLTGEGLTQRPDRTLLVHSQRLEHVQKGRNNAVMTQRWRLVGNRELYDIQADPIQSQNIASAHPEIVQRLNQVYDRWWESLSKVVQEEVHLVLGNEAENPSRLTCHDWHTNNDPVPWNHGHIRRGLSSNGFWAVEFEETGNYELTLRRWPYHENRAIKADQAQLRIGKREYRKWVNPEDEEVTFHIEVTAGRTRLQTWLQRSDGSLCGAYYVKVNYLD